MLASGVLTKRGRIFPTWRTRYFELRSNAAAGRTHSTVAPDTISMVYYVDSTKAKMKGEYVFDFLTTISRTENFGKHEFCMRIILGTGRQIFLSAPDEDIRTFWIATIKREIEVLKEMNETSECPRRPSYTRSRSGSRVLPPTPNHAGNSANTRGTVKVGTETDNKDKGGGTLTDISIS